MLAVRTVDNWAFSLTVDDGANAPEVYSNAALDGLSSVVAMLAWLNDSARAWYLIHRWTVAWTRYEYGGARLTLTASLPFTLDGGASSLLGLDADTYANSAVGISPVVGVWNPAVQPSARAYARSIGEGDAESAGAIRPGVPGTGHYLPSVSAVCSAAEAAYLTDILTNADSPRVAVVEQEHTGATLTLALGDVSRTRQGTQFAVDFAVAGEVV